MEEPFKEQLNCVFTAKGIDKAKVLDHMLVPLCINREDWMAFVDGHNDRKMLAYEELEFRWKMLLRREKRLWTE